MIVKPSEHEGWVTTWLFAGERGQIPVLPPSLALHLF
jgi:hypothetical protein